jgi:hypothetical protein
MPDQTRELDTQKPSLSTLIKMTFVFFIMAIDDADIIYLLPECT